jgi:diguanylate cyclase (GGDEF)-like protein/putative nucleotidyltransferase with HDIG domain
VRCTYLYFTILVCVFLADCGFSFLVKTPKIRKTRKSVSALFPFPHVNSMKNLPKLAKIYLAGIYLLGVASVLFAVLTPAPKAVAGAWEFMAYLALAILIGRTKIRILQRRDAEDNVSMSLAYVLTFTAMLRFGPSAAVLVGAVGSLSNCLYPKRQQTYQLAFNVALTMVEAVAASLIFLALNHHSLVLHTPESYPAVAAASLAFFLINTGGVAVVIALCTGQNAAHVWRTTFFWTAPSYFAGACVSTLALLLFNNHSAYVLILLSPLGWVMYQNYATTAARTEEKQQHIEELQLSQEHLADLYLATIKSLALAIDAKDQYTHQHILRVQRYAVAVAKHMGLTGSELEAINTGALLHDIGKLGVPEYVLLKPGRLTDEEFAKIKQHPEIGAAILDPVEFPWPVLPVVRSHHEKWDGTGYPDGLAGEDIPRTARILAVADVYDALTSSRSYRNAWTHDRACEVIRKDRGTHFDPAIADAFLEIITEVVEEMAQGGDGPLIIAEPSAGAAASPADQAAQAIHRASTELWALYEVVQTLSSSVGLQETLEILARKLEALLPGTTTLFLLRSTELENAGSDEMVVRSAVGINREFFAGAHTLGVTSLAVAQNRTTYLGGYDPDDLLLISSQITQWTPLQTALIVPIVHQGEVLGTINLYHPNPNAFSPHDRQLLETIADRAATALYNGLLFDRTRSHAFTDPLTGLYNIRHITQHVEDCCREGAPFALLCLDLDSFKPINDNFGHQKGDQVLRDLSALFQAALRSGDVAARYGGDEFLIYVEGGRAAEAEALAARLQAAVEAYEPGLIHPRLGALHLGVSIGYGCYPADGTDFAALIAAADAHMYREKTERKLGRLAGEGRSAPGQHMHDLHSADMHSLGAEFDLPRAA